ncbi:hypothetical protein Tco_0942887 [Tanacetum coccineum]
MKPTDTLLMGDEVISTITARETNEFIKSSFDDLVPISRESEVTFDSDLECDMPATTPFWGYIKNLHNPRQSAKFPFLKGWNMNVKAKYCPVTTEEKYKDAKTLFAAIQTRFGGNEATKTTLLKQMYENFSAPSTESLDFIFNRLQKIVKETSSKAMVAIDGAGFDWSYMADDEVPTNMALMAFLDSEADCILPSKGKVNVVKASAYWVSRPTKLNSASITLKRHNYVDAQGRSKVIHKKKIKAMLKVDAQGT